MPGWLWLGEATGRQAPCPRPFLDLALGVHLAAGTFRSRTSAGTATPQAVKSGGASEASRSPHAVARYPALDQPVVY